LFETGDRIGGKISSVIPGSRIPKQTFEAELARVKELIPDIRLNQALGAKEFSRIMSGHEFTIIAAGAKKPRTLPIPGIEHVVSANDFLENAKQDRAKPGRTVVIIGAGNVGCDVATEAHRLGADDITLIDVQKPAAFGKEKEDARAVGAIFRWPCFTKEITPEGVVLKDGEVLKADTVVLSIGDVPDLDFLDKTIATKNGFVDVDEFNRTSNPRVFAIGDAAGPGLITDAIGAGKRTAQAIDRLIEGKDPDPGDVRPRIDGKRVHLEYYDPRAMADNLSDCGADCASCGNCRDCGICVAVCPEGAIERIQAGQEDFAYTVDPDRCIGCGFCKGACPCGIWELVPNPGV
jgi:NADPH-dependent glutamate synthase beta subunit-like oxidoreductase/NAD-dependent dihydropyrimidine dehydrogenase PreA subunit